MRQSTTGPHVFDFQSNGTVFNYYSYVDPTFNNAGTLEMTAVGTSSVGFALDGRVQAVS